MKTFQTGAAVLAGAAAGMLLWERRRQEKAAEEHEQVGKKYYDYYQLLNRWMSCREEGKQISAFFREEGIVSIAVYGMGDLADRLAVSLADSEIEIRYGIDRDVCNTNGSIVEIYSPEDPLPKVDAIVITPFTASRQIGDMLRQRCGYRLFSLDEIIFSL